MTTLRMSVVTLKIRTLALSLLMLSACTQLESESNNVAPRPASSDKSTAVATYPTDAEVGTVQVITVKIADKRGVGIPNVQPALTAVNSSNAPTGITFRGCGVTDTKGITTCGITGSVAGAYTVRVTSPVAYVGGPIQFVQKLAGVKFTAQPSCSAPCAVGSTFTTTVQLVDKVGTAITTGPDASASVALTTSPGPFSSPITLSASGGTATISGTLPNRASTSYVFTATATSTSGASGTGTSNAFTVKPGAAHHLLITRVPAAPTSANIAFEVQPMVQIYDVHSNPVTDTNCTVTLTLASGLGTLIGTTSKITTNGVADFTGNNIRVSTTDGGSNYTLMATAAGSACASVAASVPSASFEITLAGVPAQLTILTPPGTAALSEIWPTQPVIQVLDRFGALVSTDNQTVVTINPDAGNAAPLNGPTNVQVVNGTATFSALKINSTNSLHKGTYTYNFTATSPGVVVTSISASHLITPNGQNSPFRLEFLVQPGNASKNQTMAQIKVRKVDAFGFLNFTENTETVTLDLLSGTGTITTPSIELTKPMVDGVAIFDTLRLDTPGVKSVRARSSNSGAVTEAISSNFTISDYGLPVALRFVNTIAGSTNSNPWSGPVAVEVLDSANNRVMNENSTPVTVSIYQYSNSPSASLVGSVTTKPFVNGLANFAGLRTSEFNVTNIVLRAAVENNLYAEAQSNTFNGNVAVGSQLRFAAPPINGVDSPFSPYCWASSSTSTTAPANVTVEILDSSGNRVTSDNNTTVDLACSSGCTIMPASATASAGLVTFNGLLISGSMTGITITASTTAGMTSTISGAFNTPACP